MADPLNPFLTFSKHFFTVENCIIFLETAYNTSYQTLSMFVHYLGRGTVLLHTRHATLYDFSSRQLHSLSSDRIAVEQTNLSLVKYKIRGVIQQRVGHCWCITLTNWSSSTFGIFDNASSEWRGHLRVFMWTNGGRFQQLLWQHQYPFSHMTRNVCLLLYNTILSGIFRSLQQIWSSNFRKWYSNILKTWLLLIDAAINVINLPVAE